MKWINAWNHTNLVNLEALSVIIWYWTYKLWDVTDVWWWDVAVFWVTSINDCVSWNKTCYVKHTIIIQKWFYLPNNTIPITITHTTYHNIYQLIISSHHTMYNVIDHTIHLTTYHTIYHKIYDTVYHSIYHTIFHTIWHCISLYHKP